MRRMVGASDGYEESRNAEAPIERCCLKRLSRSMMVEEAESMNTGEKYGEYAS